MNNPNNPNRQNSRIFNFLKNNPIPIPEPNPPEPPSPPIKFKHNTILIVCDQLINYKNIPDKILRIMPGYQAFKSLGIQFNNIYNNRQDCSPSRASFATSQLNVNISDNIDQSWQYTANPKLNTAFDTIGKSLKRNGYETVWYGKNHFDSTIATDVNTVPAFDTNTRGCLKEYGYDIYNTFGDSYYYTNAGMFADNMVVDLKVNYKNNNVDFEDSTGKYIGAIPYLKARAKNDKPFHLELHLMNPHDTQHFWQNFAQTPSKTQLQFWAPYINEQIALLKLLYPDNDIYNPYNFSPEFSDATIQNSNLINNYFEGLFKDYITNIDSLPFKESYLIDYVTDPESNNSQFPYYIGFNTSLIDSATMPNNKDDIMSWKNLINNYYGLLIEADHYIYEVFLLLKQNNMLNTTSVTIMSDHGDMMSSHGMKQKGLPFENSCNVACLIYSPYIPRILRGTTNNVLGSLLDIAPTIEILANIKDNKSDRFLGKSLLNWNNDNELVLVPRNEDEPIFNIYNMWLTYFTYFDYKSWIINNPIRNTVLHDYKPSNFYEYQSFFTMIIDNISGKKYKLARYFNFIELLKYNWVFNKNLSGLSIGIETIKENFSKTLNEIPMFEIDIEYANNLLSEYFDEYSTWTFKDYYTYILNKTGIDDELIKTILLIPIINITTANIGFSYIIPGYYNDNYTIGNNFLEYYNDPDHNYYFFMYNVTEDPNEVTNLLDKGHPNRQTNEVIKNASFLNDKLNLLIDKYKIVYFDFIVPEVIFTSFAINLKIYNNNITPDNSNIYTNCFGLNKKDGDLKIQPYYIETINMLKNL